MTSTSCLGRKEAFAAALQHRQPATGVPIWELEFHAWDAVSGRHLLLGREFEKLTATEQEYALHTNAEIILSVAEEMHWSAVSIPGGYWESAPGQLAYYCLPTEARYRQCEVLREVGCEDLMLVANVWGILGADYSDDFCERLFEEPERVDEMVTTILRDSLNVAARFKDCGVEAVFSASDMADNGGPFFNPNQMERWIYPTLKSWSDGLRSLGLLSILHSDGNLTPYLERLAATGINGLQAIDPIAGMDIVATKQEVGDRLCLCGNVDCGRLLMGTPDEIFETTRRLLLACKPGGNFSLGASNAVQPEVPTENYRAMIAAWKQYGAYATI